MAIKKSSLLILMVFWMAVGHAQSNPLQACALKRSKALDSVVNLKKNTDSLAAQQLAAIDQAWEKCVEEAHLPEFIQRSIAGETIDTRSLHGKMVVINFWFTSCAPCVAEIPGLNLLVKEYQDKNAAFIGFTFEPGKKIETEFLPAHPFLFQIVPDAGEMENVFGVNDYPSTFIIGPDGKIRKAWSGGKTGPGVPDEIYHKIKVVLDDMRSTMK